MKLKDKVTALLGARWRRPAPSRRIGERPGTEPPSRRPSFVKAGASSLDPGQAWGVRYEPHDTLLQQLGDFIEQLALESYHNGPTFEFSDQELESRMRAFLDHLVEKGELKLASTTDSESAAGARRWIQAQQTHIDRLVQWWRLQGGPDIEARVL